MIKNIGMHCHPDVLKETESGVLARRRRRKTGKNVCFKAQNAFLVYLPPPPRGGGVLPKFWGFKHMI